ncbi:hypothetical protein ACVWXB_005467 [Streptomyces sp. TE12347]
MTGTSLAQLQLVDPSVSIPILYTAAAVVVLCLLLAALIPPRPLNGRLAGPDPQLQLALKAVRGGAWEPAADLMEAAGTDWERRTHYAGHLAYSAAYDGDGWLKAWQAAAPDDPDAMLVAGCTRVKRAWRLRGFRSASVTSREQFAGFHQELAAARVELADAARRCPGDPTPLAGLVTVGRGLAFSKDEMGALLAEAEAASPHHFGTHYAALLYFCSKWRGSRAEVEEFAARAARQAPRGSLLALLPLLAWYEEVDLGGDPAGLFGTPHVVALVDAALEDVGVAEGHPNLPEARHLLAYFLVRQRRYRAALEQFRQVDGYANAIPWSYRPWGKLSYRLHRARAVWGALLTRR